MIPLFFAFNRILTTKIDSQRLYLYQLIRSCSEKGAKTYERDNPKTCVISRLPRSLSYETVITVFSPYPSIKVDLLLTMLLESMINPSLIRDSEFLEKNICENQDTTEKNQPTSNSPHDSVRDPDCKSKQEPYENH